VASHLGGTRDGMVVAWPKRIRDAGGLRSQFTHAIDVAPTILEAAGVEAPTTVDGVAQMPMHGTSFAYTFADAKAPERHTRQYFEIIGNRAMYQDGWLWSCRIDRIPWKFDPETIARLAPGKWNPEDDRCELYDLTRDFSQARDLAAEAPAKMRELEALFWSEAERYQVLPLLGGIGFVWGLRPAADLAPRQVVLTPGVENLAPGMIPPLYNRSFSITAEIDAPDGWCLSSLCWGGDGVIVANASFLGGFSLYVEGGRPSYTYSFLGLAIDHLVAPERLAEGRHELRYEFTADEPGKPATGGTQRLLVDGKQVAEGRLEHTVPLRFSAYAGLDVGRDNGLPVSPDKVYYLRSPFPYSGTIEKVVFDLK